jgi:hypothetical protein
MARLYGDTNGRVYRAKIRYENRDGGGATYYFGPYSTRAAAKAHIGRELGYAARNPRMWCPAVGGTVESAALVWEEEA